MSALATTHVYVCDVTGQPVTYNCHKEEIGNNEYYVEYSSNNITKNDDIVEMTEGSTYWLVS